MVYLLVKQTIRDYYSWKNAFDKFHVYRRIGGELSCEIYQTQEEENQLIILSEWSCIEDAKEFLESQAFEMIKKLEEEEPAIIQFMPARAVS
ncbi:hypothetical protein [Ancylomarina longa]|uniref:ABM domain-containing protein n=1 Tax=Ancylomarina longa TaxID=2487017 RepID=A0A434AZD1_9BACT|nr:hypothetical protein [Ancylomarina longa]RUT79865.1 hypothetical protein DLK05_00475 [Ancylomarina longa]